ncbi:MAG: M14 family zinc carboxypeptidase [Bacteroidales bacterium]
MKIISFCIALFLSLNLYMMGFSQDSKVPVKKNGYKKVTSYAEISSFVKQLDESSELVKVETIGKSVQNRDLYALKFSISEFGTDNKKLKVIFFAQQHGNEQSGKEGALLLAERLTKPEYRYLFEKIDLAIVPQMNPDGSEINSRRNGNNMDLNRNHMIMTEPEVVALHRFYEKYMFEVNMDVHEYWPFGDEYLKYGYRKNADITLGTLTNLATSQKIRDFSNQTITSEVFKHVNQQGYSTFVYCPGGPPGIDYIRHSTFDVNDGRQSFGILNGFGFIQEGMNGFDTFTDNLERRAISQMEGMFGMLLSCYQHAGEIKKIVKEERKKLSSGKDLEKISIISEHVRNGQKLQIPLFSYTTKTDSVVIVEDYRPVVKSLLDIKKPIGYLIPKNNTKLTDWAKRQNLVTGKLETKRNQKITMFEILSIDSIDFEGDKTANPVLNEKTKTEFTDLQNYVYIPLHQIKSNMIILALEPKSILGLGTYTQFEELLTAGTTFPVLRIEE